MPLNFTLESAKGVRPLVPLGKTSTNFIQPLWDSALNHALREADERNPRCTSANKLTGVKMKGILALTLLAVLIVPACSRTSADVDPKTIEAKYGLTGAYIDDVTTEEGKIKATIVPTTLEDGRKVQLIIPHERVDAEHQVFMRDGITITPMELSDPKMPRQTFVQSQPRVVERRPAVAHSSKRSWEKEVLIVGGSAGAGAAIGAAAGGGKGAGIGAMSGGVAGLVYDLATRNKK